MTDHPNPSPLFQEANRASRVVTEACARSVLRQTALESLDQIVNLDEEQIVLTNQHLEAVRCYCRQLADAWCDKLQQRGHYQAAEVIQEVVRREENVLYYVEDMAGVEKEMTDLTRSKLQEPTIASLKNTRITQEDASACITSLARIRQITSRDILAPEPPSKEALLAVASDHLEEFGRHDLTDWPFSWNLIEQKIQEIPGRLYNTKREAPVLELIPKSIWEKQQNQAMEDTEQYGYDARQLILQRRRRRRRDTSASLPAPRKRARVASPVEEDTPRPASMQPETIILSPLDDPLELADVGRYLHADAVAAGDDAIDGCLLAPLTSLGHLHYTRQLVVDDPDSASWSNHQRILAQHKARKERLGPHKFSKDSEETKSKVRRTIDASGKYWLHLDLERTMLELGPADDRKLYWFDSVEAILLDEDVNATSDELDSEKDEATENDEGDVLEAGPAGIDIVSL